MKMMELPRVVRLLVYLAFFTLGGLVAYAIGFRWAQDPHVALAVMGVVLVGLVYLTAWGEVRPWARRRGVAQPDSFALATATLTSVVWVAYVLVVTLPLAFLTDITATRQGRNALSLITFLPLLAAYVGALWFTWRRMGPGTEQDRPRLRVRWRDE